jgi:hypothetical protein
MTKWSSSDGSNGNWKSKSVEKNKLDRKGKIYDDRSSNDKLKSVVSKSNNGIATTGMRGIKNDPDEH